MSTAPGRSSGRAALGDAVRLVHADAREFLPDEPVDVVLCERLHAGLLRERQIEVIDGRKRRYRRRFGGPLPPFVPEASVLAAQPVEQDFRYFGFRAPIPVFQDPLAPQPRTAQLAAPRVYHQLFYRDRAPVPHSPRPCARR
jgi:predicted RNA methylase